MRHHLVECLRCPGDHRQRRCGEDEADEHEPDEERTGKDPLVLGARRLLHEPRARLAVAEADRLEDGDGEVDPQRLQRQERNAAEDVEDARSQERADEAEQARHLEADVAQEVVVQRATALDGLHDRREVVVGQDHHRGLLRDLGPGDPHRHADVGALQRGRVVHAVARHRDDVALAAEDVDEVDLVLRRDARDDADLVDPLVGLFVAPRRELGTGDRAALEPELACDRLCGDRVVAGDHPHLDAGILCARDRVACLGARRIHDPDERQQVQVLHLEEQVGVRVERGRDRSRAARSPGRAGPARPADRSRPGTSRGRPR